MQAVAKDLEVEMRTEGQTMATSLVVENQLGFQSVRGGIRSINTRAFVLFVSQSYLEGYVRERLTYSRSGNAEGRQINAAAIAKSDGEETRKSTLNGKGARNICGRSERFWKER